MTRNMRDHPPTPEEVEVLEAARQVLGDYGQWLHYDDGTESQSPSQVAQRLGLIIEAERRRLHLDGDSPTT